VICENNVVKEREVNLREEVRDRQETEREHSGYSLRIQEAHMHQRNPT